MNFTSAYLSQTSSPVRAPRDIEFDVVLDVTRSMRNAYNSKGHDFPKFVASIHRNRQLWKLFESSVKDSKNKLNEDTKFSILKISAFVQVYSRKITSKDFEIGPLLEINNLILKGLDCEVIVE